MLLPWTLWLLLQFTQTNSNNFFKIFSNGHVYNQKQQELNSLIKKVEQFMHLKGHNRKLSYWYYTGTLRSPSTGREIVGIEGVEIVSPIIHHKVSNKERYSPLTNNTTTSAISRNKGSSRKYDIDTAMDKYKASYLSKKIFIYVDKDNHTQVIDKFRLHPSSPQRDVRYVKQYHELITLGIDSKDQLYASTEYPSQRIIKTNKITINDNVNNNNYNHHPSTLEKLLFCKETINIVNFMSGMPRKHINRWISFSSNQDSGSRGRSQEYYTLNRNCNLFNIDIDNAIPKLRIHSIAACIEIKDKLSSWKKSFLRRMFDTTDIMDDLDDDNINNRCDVRQSKFNRFIDTYQHNVKIKNNNSNNTTSSFMSSLPIKPSTTLNYHRYGECPSFFSTDHACCLELHAVKLDSLKYLPINMIQLLTNTCGESSFLHDTASLLHRNLDDFHRQHDLLMEYQTWYSRFNIFSK